MRKYLAYILIVITTCIAGCFEGSECSSVNTNEIKVTFFDISTGEVSSKSYNAVRAVNNPELIYGAGSSLSTFILPLDPSSDQTIFLFDLETLEDTLVVNYRVRSYLKRLNCDTELEFSNLSVSTSTFDSTVVKNNNINTKVETNVKIYN